MSGEKGGGPLQILTIVGFKVGCYLKFGIDLTMKIKFWIAKFGRSLKVATICQHFIHIYCFG